MHGAQVGTGFSVGMPVPRVHTSVSRGLYTRDSTQRSASRDVALALNRTARAQESLIKVELIDQAVPLRASILALSAAFSVLSSATSASFSALSSLMALMSTGMSSE
jgi:hypothetical protein